MAKAKAPVKSKLAESPKSMEGMGVTFELRTKSGHRVYLAGSFNAWRPTEFQMVEIGKSGAYSIEIKLAPGGYAYKFVVDGKWQPDPRNPDNEPDGHGGHNSLKVVG